MAADVVLTDEAREEIKRLKNVVIAARLYKLIDRLKSWPTVSGVKALTSKLVGKYRMRTGDYRIQFHVETTRAEPTKTGEKEVRRHTIIIEKAGHRDGFYED
jgi:mRNA-degrading endonuclease RelE of RelBE toxin-antitoxin system